MSRDGRGIPLPRLGLGTAPLVPGYGLGPSIVGREQRLEIPRIAVEAGLGYIDTAAGYGDAEELLGELSELLGRHRVRVSTKLAATDLEDGLARSLRRLRREQVDTLLLHSATASDLRHLGRARAMERMKAEGMALRVGASTYGAEDARIALEQSWCDVVQVEHSILNPRVVPAVSKFSDGGREVVVRSVLCKGLLTPRRKSMGHVSHEAARVLDRLELRAREWGLTLPELAVRFALDTPWVDIVLVGAASVDEVRTAVAAAASPPLAPWQLEALEEFDCSFRAWAHPERWAVTAHGA